MSFPAGSWPGAHRSIGRWPGARPHSPESSELFAPSSPQTGGGGGERAGPGPGWAQPWARTWPLGRGSCPCQGHVCCWDGGRLPGPCAPSVVRSMTAHQRVTFAAARGKPSSGRPGEGAVRARGAAPCSAAGSALGRRGSREVMSPEETLRCFSRGRARLPAPSVSSRLRAAPGRWRGAKGWHGCAVRRPGGGGCRFCGGTHTYRRAQKHGFSVRKK